MNHRGSSRQKTHAKPDALIATKPNQVWSWDITYLFSTIRGNFYYLYMFIDIYSRKIVDFSVSDVQSAEHASKVVSMKIFGEVRFLVLTHITSHNRNIRSSR
jgi:putative transposase